MIPWDQESGVRSQGSAELFNRDAKVATTDRPRKKPVLWPLVPLVAVLASALAYGHFRMAGDYMRPGPTVALIQGNYDPKLENEPESDVRKIVFQHYYVLSQKALVKTPHIDLLVWPETMYPYGLIETSPDFHPPQTWESTPAEITATAPAKYLVDLQHAFQSTVEETHGAPLPPPLLLGEDAIYFSNDREQHFNSAPFVDSLGQPLAPTTKCIR